MYRIRAVLFCISMIGATAVPVVGNESTGGASPDQALQFMREGNGRFAGMLRTYPHQDAQLRQQVAEKGQKPFVTVVGCSDSRVPLEHLFDAGIGDLFVVRVAGNVCDTDEIGSVEYGVGHLGTPLLVVLGHTRCGAVTAVVKGDPVQGSIPALVDNIIPAVEKAKAEGGGKTEAALIGRAIELNVWQSVADIITGSEEVANLVREGRVKVVGAVYHLENGTVEWLGEHPGMQELLARSGEEAHRGFPWRGLVIAAFCLAVFLLVIQLLFFIEATRIRRVQIKGRLIAGFLSLMFGPAAAMTLLRQLVPGAALGTRELLAAWAVLLAVALVYAGMYVSSIIGSFRRVIRMLRGELEKKEEA